MKNYKALALIISLLLLAFCFFICYFLPNDLRNIVNYITIIGTTLSLIGLIFAFLQITSINQSNTETQFAVKGAIIRMNQILSVSDITKCIKNIDEIQNYIVNREIGLALLRMKDIRDVIIGLKHKETLKEITSKKDYTSLISTFEVDTESLNSYIEDSTLAIKFEKIVTNLGRLASKLTELENHLKNL